MHVCVELLEKQRRETAWNTSTHSYENTRRVVWYRCIRGVCLLKVLFLQFTCYCCVSITSTKREDKKPVSEVTSAIRAPYWSFCLSVCSFKAPRSAVQNSFHRPPYNIVIEVHNNQDYQSSGNKFDRSNTCAVSNSICTRFYPTLGVLWWSSWCHDGMMHTRNSSGDVIWHYHT